MKFVAISDTHCRHHQLKLPEGDVLLHAGDISYRGFKSEITDFFNWFGQQKFTHKIVIAGNHDFYLEKLKADEIKALIPKGVTYLNDSFIVIEGIKIWGSPVTPWYYNWAFNRHRGAAINKHWNLIPADTNVLLTHGPVYGILDSLLNGRNTGCRDLLHKVKEIKPQAHVFGHIHESYGMVKRFGVRFINACVLNESYERINKPVVFEL